MLGEVSTMYILFFLRRDRANEKGLCPIYFRITINGERMEPPRFTGQRVNPERWVNQRVKGDTATNLILDTIEFKLKSIHASMIANNEPQTVSRVVAYFDGKAQIGLIDLANLYFAYCYKKSGAGLDAGEYVGESTIKTYQYKFANVERFLQSKRIKGILAHQLTPPILAQLTDWLRFERGEMMQRSTIARHIIVLKKIIAFGYEKGYLTDNPIKDFEYSRGADKIPFNLTPEEVQKILLYPFNNELQAVADLFLLQCYTGFYLADIYNFTSDNIKSIRGQSFIVYKRNKNGNTATVPLSQGVKVLIEKYCFSWPEIKADRYNQLLKRVGDRVGLQIGLTMKIGRKTFTSLMKNHEGYSTTAIAAMMGHVKETSQNHYARPTGESVVNELLRRIERTV